MTLQDKTSKALKQGKIDGAKKLASLLLSKQDKEAWSKAKQVEYDELFPSYREANEDEVYEQQEHYLRNASDGTLLREDVDFSEFIYAQVPIDYSENDNYLTYNDWLNETRVISEVVEEVAHIEEVDGIETRVVDVEYQPEVTELVRPYVPKDILDTEIEEYLNTLPEYHKYLNLKKEEAKSNIISLQNNVRFQGDFTSLGYINATVTVANARFNLALCEVLGIMANGNDELVGALGQLRAIYDTEVNWKNADNKISVVQIETLLDALEDVMRQTASEIGVENELP